MTGHIVLRVPVLYGSVEYLGESAVTVLLELLFKTEKKPLSDYEIRFPSHVDDIASVCLSLLELKLTNSSIGGNTFIVYSLKAAFILDRVNIVNFLILSIWNPL